MSRSPLLTITVSIVAALAALASLVQAVRAEKAARPNIVLIMSDDN